MARRAGDRHWTAGRGDRARPAGVRTARRFAIDGLCCAAEARQIEAALGRRADVESLRIDAVGHTIHVAGPIATADVEREIARLGMAARPLERDAAATAEAAATAASDDRRARLAYAAAAGLLWIASVVAGRLIASQTAAALLAAGAVAAGGRYVFPRALRAARRASLDMNFLMASAAIGALVIGEYAEAASVMFLFAVAQLLEASSMHRARAAIRSLMRVAPATATVRQDGREVSIDAALVAPDDTIIVRPGEKIAADGVVIAGSSAVDQSPITGESIPVDKSPGDEVFAGSINGQGVLEVRSTRAAEDTTLARIIHSVEEAQASRAPSQTFVDRFARVYTPAVVATAALLAILPPLLAGGGAAAFSDWFYRALALLVVACPCALVISTPVTVVSALAGAARRGILIKGGLHLENAGRATAIAFDKTGTLTEGRPHVTAVVPFNGTDARHLLACAAAVEAHSQHPLAAAIRDHARKTRVKPAIAAAARALPGLGAEALIAGEWVRAGSPRLFGMGPGESDRPEQPSPSRRDRLRGSHAVGDDVAGASAGVDAIDGAAEAASAERAEGRDSPSRRDRVRGDHAEGDDVAGASAGVDAIDGAAEAASAERAEGRDSPSRRDRVRGDHAEGDDVAGASAGVDAIDGAAEAASAERAEGRDSPSRRDQVRGDHAEGDGMAGADALRELERAGGTIVLVGTADRVLGGIAIADAVRSAAPRAIQALRDAGITEIVMLTGDNTAAATAVATTIGPALTGTRAGLLPADKVAAIEDLRARHPSVLMVGDGINDAPALAAADVGIAMGAAGTDVALETADIALMADDLDRLPVLIRLARKAERIIRANIAFALAIKAVFVILAAAGIATLWMAVLADMGASLIVIANGMRALRV